MKIQNILKDVGVYNERFKKDAKLKSFKIHGNITQALKILRASGDEELLSPAVLKAISQVQGDEAVKSLQILPRGGDKYAIVINDDYVINIPMHVNDETPPHNAKQRTFWEIAEYIDDKQNDLHAVVETLTRLNNGREMSIEDKKVLLKDTVLYYDTDLKQYFLDVFGLIRIDTEALVNFDEFVEKAKGIVPTIILF